MKLRRATLHDLDKLWSMQTEAFSDLLRHYRDYETSPGNEPKERIKAKLLDASTYFYFIYLEERAVGAVRVVDQKDGTRKRVAPIFITKEFRNRGLAQQVFQEIEAIHGGDNWMLDTILQEKGNCHLYEKLGYVRTGVIEPVNERMDIVYYEKN